MKRKPIKLDGQNLKIAHIGLIVNDPETKIEISKKARKNVKASYDFLHKEFDNKIIYGINTGFGPMASHVLAKGQLNELQINLIRSHAVGMGQPIDSRFVLAAMLIRLNMLIKGHSGVSEELVILLQNFINHRIIPIVYEHGAVGTSGDLVQLAHIALALIGEGRVFYKNRERNTNEVLKELNLRPVKLQIKEGLALINGTAMMTGIGALLCIQAKRLLNIAVKNGALSLEVVHAFNDGIDKNLHMLRPHKGQVEIAGMLRKILYSSRLLRKRSIFKDQINNTDDVTKLEEAVQEVYSLRCIPQILGPVYDTLEKTTKDIETEMNSVTDNPVLDYKKKDIFHGGNFHGDQISSSLDQLKMTLVKLTMLSERRINYFLNENINKRFPPFMNLDKPGLTLGLQGLQFVATSTTAQSQTLAFPQYVHSIPTNGDNQDIVSMGTDAALLTSKVIENAFIVLAIELLALAQGVDFLEEGNKLSKSSKNLFDDIRSILPKITKDRVVTEELDKVVDFLKNEPELNI